jgi:hypothetical protein
MTALRTAHAPAGQVSRRRASTGSGGELASLCVGIAAVGMAALGSAASSSLAAGLNGTAGLAAWWGWAAAIGSAGWAGTALLYAVATFRAGHLPLPGLAVRAVGVAASVHLAGIVVASTCSTMLSLAKTTAPASDW